MLIREEGDAAIAIGQASHAWIAGQLARAWGNDRFPPPEPREEVCLAAEQHDVGMAEWDLRPSLNPRTGLPHTFLELPVEVHVALWGAAPDKLASQSRYSATLVSMHGTALNEHRALAKLTAQQRELVREYLEGQRELQRTLTSLLSADRDELTRNQRLLWTWDSLSLALCLFWRKSTLADVPASDGRLDLELVAIDAHHFTLDPWPFARDRVEVHCEGRPLNDRFDAEPQLHQALRRAPAVRMDFTVARP